ncbi:MAG: GNAT family N-acetyltransferase [Cyclobacteriaceae bacterium]|nr:GNAT family N-acetyltransferase [Cyclobacteriaceae bacterium]
MILESTIINTTEGDLPEVYILFEKAIEYQKSKNYPVWHGFDRLTLVHDVASKNHYKIIRSEKMAMVFSVCYADPLIWGKRETGESIYLHRIVVNPQFKGQKLFSDVLAWAINHGIMKSKKSIRMDTWVDNANIIDYYKSFGFQFIDNARTPDDNRLAVQNRNLNVALLQYDLSDLLK